MVTMDNGLATRLAPLAVLDERGAAVRLGPLWERVALLLAFVRHFG
jgi:hypothetical protein